MHLVIYVHVHAYLADYIHDPYRTVIVELSGLNIPISIFAQQSDQCSGTIARFRQDDWRVKRHREELDVLRGGREGGEGGGRERGEGKREREGGLGPKVNLAPQIVCYICT